MTERKPIIDEHFTYRGLHAGGAVTRVRVYDTEPLIVIASELEENAGASITNSAEYLWPEIVKKYLPHRREHTPPAKFIEHYPAFDAYGHREKDTYSEVLFTRSTPQVVHQGRLMRLSYGEPKWKHLSEGELSNLLAEGGLRKNESQ